MADLIQDTGARENTAETRGDPQKNGSGSSDAPGGGSAPAQSVGDMTQGQEAYGGPRAGGESDKHDANDNNTSDASQNNVLTPVGGDTDPDSNASSIDTGQAGTDDRPGKNTGHPWNG